MVITAMAEVVVDHSAPDLAREARAPSRRHLIILIVEAAAAVKAPNRDLGVMVIMEQMPVH